jgi:hypothetical protein
MPKTSHQDGSSKSESHISQVMFPESEFRAARRLSLSLGIVSFSTFVRSCVRLALQPEHRGAVVQEYEQILAEQRGLVAPRFGPASSTAGRDEVVP